jgi:hypothetical protein
VDAELVEARPDLKGQITERISGVCPCQAPPHHGSAKVFAVHMADRDSPAVVVRRDAFALRRAFSHEAGQCCAGRFAGTPAIGAGLRKLWGIDAVQAKRLLARSERVAVDDDSVADGLRRTVVR